ncbi:MAG: phospholipase D-like domain-containing protein [Actinomycetota bacterium]|nr:phospholipase D-like domain-containing protein [Actinomycetota bacterium]
MPYARDELLGRIADARERVWLVSPFLTAPVADDIREALPARSSLDLRLLTALVPRSVQVGVLSPSALVGLRESGFKIASIPNLHAKVSLVDSSWGLVGSGNLTGAGLRSGKGGNVELGVRLDEEQRSAASALAAEWWEKAEAVTHAQIQRYAELPPLPKLPADLPEPGDPLPLDSSPELERILAEDEKTAGGRRYWIKSNYHRAGDEAWWHREWVSDWRQAPYEEGDLMVLYLSAWDGGPACCPAVVRVTKPSRFDRQWVIEHRDADAADRWPYVTEVAVVDEVPIDSGAPLSAIGKTGQSVQGGYCSITRDEFEALVGAMRA